MMMISHQLWIQHQYIIVISRQTPVIKVSATIYDVLVLMKIVGAVLLLSINMPNVAVLLRSSPMVIIGCLCRRL